jgi:leucyl/phenylalanyl-tRNA--protein transferase
MPIYRLTRKLEFPPPELAEDGLLAVGGDLSTERLLLAYRSGIFPWYSDGEPILWWSPDPRMLLFPGELHLSQRFRRTLRSGKFAVTLDTAFPEVIRACAAAPRPTEEGTWITSDMQEAYIRLHDAGYAHSLECWREGVLAGGLYGVSLGACFFGESMFSRQADASKTALAALCGYCLEHGIGFIDCQVHNPHLERLGAREISRRVFLRLLREGLRGETRKGPWTNSKESL